MAAGYIPYRYSPAFLDNPPCEGCVFYTFRDYGYGAHERHDAYCTRRSEWEPVGCKDKQEDE